MEAQFSYKASARPIQERPRYRDEASPTTQVCNIAVDPRIYRGSTYARRNVLTEKIEPIPSYPKKSKSRNISAPDNIPKEGFNNGSVQTDPFDDADVIVIKQENESGVQTEPYQEKPVIRKQPAPLVAIGVRTNAPGSELFDFEQEVKPFVITLVQKALSQASMEVHEEEELANMQRYLRAFEQSRKQEQANIAKIEQLEAEKFAQKEKIVAERLKIEETRILLQRKVLARGFAEFYVWDLTENAIRDLEKKKYFYDEMEKSIETTFLPYLLNRSMEEMDKQVIPGLLYSDLENQCVTNHDQATSRIQDTVENEINSKATMINRVSRLMIAEDLVASRLRKKKAIDRKKNTVPDEEEDENPTQSTDDTQSTA